MNYNHWRFVRSVQVNAPIEDWTPSDRKADKLVFWACVAIALWFLCTDAEAFALIYPLTLGSE